MTTTTTRAVALPGAGSVDVVVADYGRGQPFLLLHGGGGPDSVIGFGELLAESLTPGSSPTRLRGPCGPMPRPASGTLRCTSRSSASSNSRR
jgi:hypothetical protein